MAEATLVVSTVECGKGYSTCTFSREAARNFRIVPPANAADSQIGVASFLEHGPGHATFTGR